jgi:hypothetical protein
MGLDTFWVTLYMHFVAHLSLEAIFRLDTNAYITQLVPNAIITSLE